MTRKASLFGVSLLLSLPIACSGEEFESPSGEGSVGGTGGNGGVAGAAAGSAGAAAGGTGGAAGGGDSPVVDCTGVEDGVHCVADGENTLCLDGSCVESRCGDGYVDTEGGESCDDGQYGDDTDGCTDVARPAPPTTTARIRISATAPSLQ